MNIVMIGSIECDGLRMAKLADKINDVLPIFDSVVAGESKVIYPTRRDSEKERLFDVQMAYIKYIHSADVVIAFPKKIFIEDDYPLMNTVKYAFGECTTYELATAMHCCDVPILVINPINELEKLDPNNIVDLEYVIPDREEKENE